MSKLMPGDIRDAVADVLRNTAAGRGPEGRGYLSAYQILDRLPADLRARLIAERGMPGAGSGNPHSAVKVVADAAAQLQAEVIYVDTRDVLFEVAGAQVAPGYEVSGFYRFAHSGSGSSGNGTGSGRNAVPAHPPLRRSGFRTRPEQPAWLAEHLPHSADEVTEAFTGLLRKGLITLGGEENEAGQREILVVPGAPRRNLTPIELGVVDYLLGAERDPAHPYVRRTPGVCGGAWVIRGTGIATEAIANYFHAGKGIPDIQRDFPFLTEAEILDAFHHHLEWKGPEWKSPEWKAPEWKSKDGAAVPGLEQAA